MQFKTMRRRIAAGAVVLSVCLGGRLVMGEEAGPTVGAADGGAAAQAGPAPVAMPAQHPLMPALNWAKTSYDKFNQQVKDYTCTLIKRERINGTLLEHEYIFTKVRNQPFSVYMYFLGPAAQQGREVIYVEGKNNGDLLAHEGKGPKALFGTVSLKPTSILAMNNNRYPITEVGIKNLMKRLIEVAENDVKYGECNVQFFKGAKVGDVTTTLIDVVHPTPRRNFLFNEAKVYVDEERDFPIRYEAYDWPETPGGAPVLLEEYTYTNVKINVGLTDADFDDNNPAYKFKKK
jgi:hypothetical protein